MLTDLAKDMTNLSVKRNEIKYFISTLQYHNLALRLKHILQTDCHSLPHRGYFVRSLYFDSHNDESLQEKLAGNKFRRKYRMRIYDCETSSVKCEIKHKLNDQIFKETATISRAHADAIINGRYEVLLDYDNPVLSKIYTKFTKGCYRPKVLVDYIRDAYVFDPLNIRITFDKDVRSNCCEFDIFAGKICMHPVFRENKQVLELKYDSYLPDYIKNVIASSRLERAAISKYISARQLLKRNLWEDQ